MGEGIYEMDVFVVSELSEVVEWREIVSWKRERRWEILCEREIRFLLFFCFFCEGNPM